jgi:hypothetical protein
MAVVASCTGREHMENQYKIFVFKSTYLTFKAERALKNAGLTCKVVTKPRDISSDCGLAIRVSATDEPTVFGIMSSSGIASLGVW